MPPLIGALVLVLQKLGGMSGREPVERFTFGVRWRHAAEVGDCDAAPIGRAHTVLVDLRASGGPTRICRAVTEVPAQETLIGVKRPLDSARRWPTRANCCDVVWIPHNCVLTVQGS